MRESVGADSLKTKVHQVTRLLRVDGQTACPHARRFSLDHAEDQD